MNTEPFPPKILVTQGTQDDGLPLLIRPATFVGMHAGIPAYHIDPPRLEPNKAGVCTECGGKVFHREGRLGEFDHECHTRLESDTNRAMDLIGKALGS